MLTLYFPFSKVYFAFCHGGIFLHLYLFFFCFFLFLKSFNSYLLAKCFLFFPSFIIFAPFFNFIFPTSHHLVTVSKESCNYKFPYILIFEKKITFSLLSVF
ncbi:hypothetical protein MANES_17G094533v8 [Manihot esculenta]|uniref:Uncharacterized protein n=1 Tax=Manihot esculenta TaxID=3983 RepID=A0ACB7G3K4_MANES|nr:hypothetical protein MANES_17G094533v8 [Manihot esculenta]